MKNTKNKLFAIVCTLALAVAGLVATPRAEAQSPTAIQAVAQELRAASAVGTSATSATTITLTPPGSQYVYIGEIDIQNCAGASAVTAAAPTTITTTNITGSPAFTVGSGVGAGLCTSQTINYPNGLKATAPGTPVTIVLPTFATNQTIRVNVAWYPSS